MGSTTTTTSSHVAFLAFPFGTHAAPLFSLATSLASTSSAASSFSFLTSARSAASLSASCQHKNIKFYEVSDGTPPGHVAAHEHPELEVGRFMSKTPTNFIDALNSAEAANGGTKITCVVSDAFLWFAGEIAKDIGVPWVALWTGGPCSLSAHLYTDLLREKKLGEEDDIGCVVKGLAGLRTCDLPEGVVVGDLTKGFGMLLHQMALALPRADAVAANTFEGLDVELDSDFKSKFKKYYPIGPLNLMNSNQKGEDRFDCIQWLDRHESASVVYVSFGTVVSLPPPELAELALGLEASEVPFIWSLKDEMRGLLPDGFLDRTKDQGLVMPWAPQVEVLSHGATGAFLTHCGWNSVLESITCGVPLMCRPVLGDQTVNARVVSHVWKCGVGFENRAIKKGELVKGLDRVVKSEEGKAMRERMGKLKEIAIGAVQPDGSSVRNFKDLLEMIMKN